jgi:hypothetical protein
MTRPAPLALVRQPKGSKVCGQACVAMHARLDLRVVCKVMGSGGTSVVALRRGLRNFRLRMWPRIALRLGELPPPNVRGIARVWRPGSRWGGHWVVLDYGFVLDPGGLRREPILAHAKRLAEWRQWFICYFVVS